ncbi:hypothetical protein [Yinghuangia seranimata]|uniref:hypothetical protein n=1 Tax=Yinghuangia seranimata TaxID=408067 RepID=UPI00248C828F|nr:hypothetical protein [Yinghuangia seranimata]MDI2132275.1 hypothetical protein [Yinghuangia seranimata]
MNKRVISKALAAAGAAVGLIAAGQGQAGAAAQAWSLHGTNLGSAVCSEAFNPTPDSAIMACLTYSGSYVVPYSIFVNGSTDARLNPATTVAIPFGSTSNTCPAEAPGQGWRYCNGPLQKIGGGCFDIVGVAQFTWYTDRQLVSPPVRICG